MISLRPHSTPAPAPHARRGACAVGSGKGGVHSEAGFTLIELLVTMVVAAVLGSMAVFMVLSARHAGAGGAAASAARTYAAAARQFQLDHNHRAPVLGTADWPATPAPNPSSPVGINGGPVNGMMSNSGCTGTASEVAKCAMRSLYTKGAVPEAVGNGTVLIGDHNVLRPGTAQYLLEYSNLGPGGVNLGPTYWRVTVYQAVNGNWAVNMAGQAYCQITSLGVNNTGNGDYGSC
jgi:prepilin-type N-terminal cleavage/methylation domain-containing protein